MFSVRIGDVGPSHDLRYWVNSGLMTLFFYVAGLEVRREFDMGELRDRRRVTLPVIVGIGGIVIPIVGFLALTLDGTSVYGWAITMSTDTAFALGMLALVGHGAPDRLRAFLLTVSIVDDLAALIVIAVAYSHGVRIAPLLVTLALFVIIVTLVVVGVSRGVIYAALGVCAWLALSASRIDPIVIGIAMAGSRPRLPRGEATSNERVTFSELPRTTHSRAAAISETWARFRGISKRASSATFHPWTSYLIVPIFALANAGIVVRGSFLAQALRSPITLGILLGSVLGKPLGVIVRHGSPHESVEDE